MVTATFFRKGGLVQGFSVSGHANFADYGQDIVCSAVSSAVLMACNALTEIVREQAHAQMAGDTISCVNIGVSDASQAVSKGLQLHLESLSKEYPKSIVVEITEV